MRYRKCLAIFAVSLLLVLTTGCRHTEDKPLWEQLDEAQYNRYFSSMYCEPMRASVSITISDSICSANSKSFTNMQLRTDFLSWKHL